MITKKKPNICTLSDLNGSKKKWVLNSGISVCQSALISIQFR